jgi:hypothetical protein
MSDLIHKCFIVSPLLAYTCVCHARKSCMRDESGVPSAASFRSGIAHHLCRYYHAHHLLEMICVLQPARRDVESPGSEQPQLLFLHLYTFCWLCSSSGDRQPKHSGLAITPAQTWDSMLGGLVLLRGLAPLWSSGLRQSRAGEQHLLQHVPHGNPLACHPT